MFTFPIAHFGTVTPIEITYTDEYSTETNASSYSFSQDYGTADADRYVIVGVFGFNSSGTRTVSSVTIGGEAATELASVQTSSNLSVYALYGAYVTTGTSGTVVATFNGTVDRFACVTYTVLGLKSTTPVDSDSANTTTTTPTSSVLVKAGGGIISICGVESSGGTSFAWDQLDEDVDSSAIAAIANSYYSGASKVFATGRASQTVSLTQSNSTARQALLTLSMR